MSLPGIGEGVFELRNQTKNIRKMSGRGRERKGLEVERKRDREKAGERESGRERKRDRERKRERRERVKERERQSE